MNKLGRTPEEHEAVKQALKIAMEADVAAGAKRPMRRKVRPDILVGWGAYDWPDWRNSRSIGRQYFLEAVAAVAPHVYIDLASTPFTLYRETPFLQDDDDQPFEFDENEFRHFLMGDPDPHYASPDGCVRNGTERRAESGRG